MRCSPLISLFLAAFLSAAPAAAREIAAHTEVTPDPVMVGQSAQYVVSFVNTNRIPELIKPRVDGLDFSDIMSTSNVTQIINSQTRIQTRALWTFTPTRTGSFTIPGRTVQISGQQVDIPPVSFRAVPMDEETRSRAFLELDLPPGPWFVGEAIPARLGLFVRADLNVNIAFPEREGDAFINSEIDNNAQRSRTRINNRLYEALVWEIIITPIKTGPAELAFRQNIALQIPVADSRFPSIFSMARTRTENVTLRSDPIETDILPLPSENRPDSFRDAIGTFEVSARLSSRDLQVGEPITLTLILSGEGNFDRISPPELPDWENWRIYPPKSDFQPDDRTGFKGTKTFEYILIPQSTDIEAIPDLTYATFNPETETYETTVLDAEPVTVKPAAEPVDEGPILVPGEETAEDRSIPDSLLPIRPETGSLQPDADPWRRPVFWIVNGLVALVLLSLAWWEQRRRRLREDTRLARRHYGSRRVRKALQNARAAAQANDPARFFDQARLVIQEQASHLASSPVEAKTLVTSDCLAILQDSDLPESLIQKCATLLNAADAHQFAGSSPDGDRLAALLDDLITLTTDINRLQK